MITLLRDDNSRTWAFLGAIPEKVFYDIRQLELIQIPLNNTKTSYEW